MKSAILLSVRSRDYTTFQDLADDVPGFHGEFAMFNPEQPNLVVWHACSDRAIEALADLMGAGEIRMEVAPKVCYRDDGDLPALPVCRTAEVFERAAAEPVWFPVVFVESYEGPQRKIREDRFA